MASTSLLNSAGETSTAALTGVDFGTDDAGNVYFDIANGDPVNGIIGTNTATSVLTSGGLDLYYYTIDNGQTLLASTTPPTGTAPTLTNDSDVVFYVNISGNTSNGYEYTVTNNSEIDNGAGFIFSATNTSNTGSNQNYTIISLSNFNTNNPPQVLLTAFDGDSINGTPGIESVNISANSWGVAGGQSISDGEQLVIDFGYFTEGTDPNQIPLDFTYINYAPIQGASVLFAKGSAGADATFYAVTPQPTNDTNTNNTSSTVVDLDSFSITTVQGNTEFIDIDKDGASGDVTIDGRTYDWTFNDLDNDASNYESVSIENINNNTGQGTGDTIAIYGKSTFGRLVVEGDSNTSFGLRDFGFASYYSGDDVSTELPIEVVDADGDSVNSDFTITWTAPQSAPTANPDSAQGVEGGIENVQVIVDLSGSIVGSLSIYDDILADVQTGLIQLADDLAQNNVQNIQVVTFAGNSNGTGGAALALEQSDIPFFKDWVNALDQYPNDTTFVLDNDNIGIWTDYNDAIALAQTAWDAFKPSGSDQGNSASFFISDGIPQISTSGSQSDAELAELSTSETTDWRNYVDNNFKESFAIGIPNNISANIDQLSRIAYNPQDPTSTLVSSNINDNENILVDPSATQLGELLESAVDSVIVNGNVITNDTPGPSGYGTPIVVEVTYNATLNGDAINSDATITFTGGGQSDSIETKAGRLNINADGSFTFAPTSGIDADTSVTLGYTIQDNSNSSQASSTLTLTAINDDTPGSAGTGIYNDKYWEITTNSVDIGNDLNPGNDVNRIESINVYRNIVTVNDDVLASVNLGADDDQLFVGYNSSNGGTISTGITIDGGDGIDFVSLDDYSSSDWDNSLESRFVNFEQVQFGTTSSTIYSINPDGSLGSAIPPVAIDLNGNGINYLSRADNVIFTDSQLNTQNNLAWVGPEDGLLVLDTNQSGDIDLISEFAFAQITPEDDTDFEALATVFDSNSDGYLDQMDDQFSDFAVWQDLNSDAKTDEGELFSLNELGIESIELSYKEDSEGRSDADGDVTILGQANVNYADGSIGLAEDTTFASTVLFEEGTSTVDPGDSSVAETTGGFDVTSTASTAELIDQFLETNPVDDEIASQVEQELMMNEPGSDSWTTDADGVETTFENDASDAVHEDDLDLEIEVVEVAMHDSVNDGSVDGLEDYSYDGV